MHIYLGQIGRYCTDCQPNLQQLATVHTHSLFHCMIAREERVFMQVCSRLYLGNVKVVGMSRYSHGMPYKWSEWLVQLVHDFFLKTGSLASELHEESASLNLKASLWHLHRCINLALISNQISFIGILILIMTQINVS